MNYLSTILEKITAESAAFVRNTEAEQAILAITIIVVGIFAVSFLIRFLRKLSRRRDETQPPLWRLRHYSLPLKLICYAAILRLAELPLQLQPVQTGVIHFIESLLIAISLLLLLFALVNQGFIRIRESPSIVNDHESVQQLLMIGRLIKILIAVVTTIGFVFSQPELFDSWLIEKEWWTYLLAVVLIILLWSLNLTIGRFLLRFASIISDSNAHRRMRLILSSLLWPIRILVIALIIYMLETVFGLPDKIEQFLSQSEFVLITLAGFLLIYNLLDVLDDGMSRYVERDDNLLDKTFAQVVKLVLRLVVLTIAAIYLIQTLSGKPVSALLAGLGIGALAIALAAQDTLKNLFGSIMIMVDKPFEIGQRIVADGFDGYVTGIGFRSTRIRTLTGHEVTVPNDRLASQSIENIGRRPHIRRMTNIGITYDTPPEKVEKALQLVREILDNHRGMDPEFPPRVYFDEFNDSSLNLRMLYWFHPADYWEYLEFTEEVNLKIMRAFEAEGIEFAFPTSTTYLAQDDRRQMKIRLEGESNEGDR